MIIDISNAYVHIKDGSGKQAEVKIGEGNFTFNITRNLDYKKDRKKLDTVREGEEEPLAVNFDMQWEWLVGENPFDIITNPNGTYVTTDTDPCQPYAVDIQLRVKVLCGMEEQYQDYLFPLFRHEGINFDTDAGTIAFNGTCNVTMPTISALIEGSSSSSEDSSSV